jgi:hypothetical protein
LIYNLFIFIATMSKIISQHRTPSYCINQINKCIGLLQAIGVYNDPLLYQLLSLLQKQYSCDWIDTMLDEIAILYI